MSRYSNFEESRRQVMTDCVTCVKGVIEYPDPALPVKCAILKPRHGFYDNVTIFYQEVNDNIVVVKSIKKPVCGEDKTEEVKGKPFLQPGIVKYDDMYYNVYKKDGKLEVVKL